jgi:hypothetical protein
VNTGSLSWSGPTGTARYDRNASVTITVIPEGSSRFSGWSGDLTGTQSNVTITMDGSKEITANLTRGATGSSYTLSSGSRSATSSGSE